MQITSVNIMTITLDRAVAEAFQEVADAMADREKTQNEASTYASAVIPKARGEARASVGEAQNYKRQRVAEAIGEVARFLAVLTEYEKQPDVSRTRLYLEAMERALGRAKLYVVDPGDGRAPLTLRLIAPQALRKTVVKGGRPHGEREPQWAPAYWDGRWSTPRGSAARPDCRPLFEHWGVRTRRRCCPHYGQHREWAE
jgi:hypothetical protein